MKNFVIGILTALMIGGWAVAAEEKNEAEVSGIRVSHGMVTVLSENGTWEEIGSVSALKAAIQEHDSPAIEAVVAVPKTAVEEKNNEPAEETSKETEELKEETEDKTIPETLEEKKNEIVARVKEAASEQMEEVKNEETADEENKEENKEEAEETAQEAEEESAAAIISIATDENGEILINGKATGYRLARMDETKEEKSTEAEETEAEVTEAKETEAEETEAVKEDKEEGRTEAEPEEKAEEEPEEEPVMHEVKIIYIDEEGEEAGKETLMLAEGVHENPELTLPAETSLVSDPKITVKEGSQTRILIVHRITVYPVELTYLDNAGNVISTATLELAPGEYSTDITQSKGKDLTILPESGYVAVYPKTFKVDKANNSYDIVVKKGNTCGENAEYDEKKKACVCKLNFEGDPYAKGCTVVPNN